MILTSYTLHSSTKAHPSRIKQGAQVLSSTSSHHGSSAEALSHDDAPIINPPYGPSSEVLLSGTLPFLTDLPKSFIPIPTVLTTLIPCRLSSSASYRVEKPIIYPPTTGRSASSRTLSEPHIREPRRTNYYRLREWLLRLGNSSLWVNTLSWLAIADSCLELGLDTQMMVSTWLWHSRWS
ncbi:hypothetical protein Tco_0327512 [Tanacetum coccineum]